MVTTSAGVTMNQDEALKLGTGASSKVYLYFPRIQLDGGFVYLNGRLFEQPLADQAPPPSTVACAPLTSVMVTAAGRPSGIAPTASATAPCSSVIW